MTPRSAIKSPPVVTAGNSSTPTDTARDAPDGHPLSPNNYYDRLNWHEKKWCAVPWQGVWCPAAYVTHAHYAFESTERHFPGDEHHNNAADAFRHCYWSARMALHMGQSMAKGFGDRHEMTPGQPLPLTGSAGPRVARALEARHRAFIR